MQLKMSFKYTIYNWESRSWIFQIFSFLVCFFFYICSRRNKYFHPEKSRDISYYFHLLLFCTVSIYIFLKLKIIFFLLLLVLSFFFCCNIVQWTLAFHCHNHYHRILRIIMGTTVVHTYESSIILLALYSNYHRLI